MRAALLLVFGVLLLDACQAEAPRPLDGSFPTPGQGQYATVASCVPSQPCPGSSCALNVVGQPDGLGVDLKQCSTLDVVFTGGTITASGEEGADLAVYLTRMDGRARVEGSSDGYDYVILGFIGGLPAGALPTCLAEVTDNVAEISLGRCHHLANVRHLRLTHDPVVEGSLAIDAFEARSFKPLAEAGP